MTQNHIGKRRIVDNQPYVRRAVRLDSILLAAGVLVLLGAFAVIVFIWAHPVL